MYKGNLDISYIPVLQTHLLFVSPSKNQDSPVKTRLGTHLECYRDVSIFGKLLDKRVAYSSINPTNPQTAILRDFFFFRVQNKGLHFMKTAFFHFMMQISSYILLDPEF